MKYAKKLVMLSLQVLLKVRLNIANKMQILYNSAILSLVLSFNMQQVSNINQHLKTKSNSTFIFYG